MKNYVTVQEMRQKKKQQQIDIKNKIDTEVGKAARGILKIVFSNGEERIIFSDDCRKTAQLVIKKALAIEISNPSYRWLLPLRERYNRPFKIDDFNFTVLFVESEYEKI